MKIILFLIILTIFVLLNCCLDCFSKAILHLNILLHEHFQVKRPLIKYWRYPTIKDKTSNRKSESDDVDTIQISPKLSSYHPGPLEHFPFHQLSAASACFTEQNVLVAKLNAGWKVERIQSFLASLKKNLIFWMCGSNRWQIADGQIVWSLVVVRDPAMVANLLTIGTLSFENLTIWGPGWESGKVRFYEDFFGKWTKK